MINIFTPNDNASGYAHGVITPGFIWAILIVSFVFLSALALFLWYIHYYKKANTSKDKTYILKIEDMDESQKKDQ